MQSTLNRVLSDIRMVKFSTAESQEIERGFKNINNIFKSGVQEGKFMAIVEPFTIGVLMVVTIVVFSYGAIRIDNGTLSAGSLVAIIYCLLQLLNPCVEITNFYARYNKFLGACENLESILQNPTEEIAIDEKENRHIENGLIFDKVTFSYAKIKKFFRMFLFKYDRMRKLLL